MNVHACLPVCLSCDGEKFQEILGIQGLTETDTKCITEIQDYNYRQDNFEIN